MNMLWKVFGVIGFIASVITLLVFFEGRIEGQEKLSRGPCQINPDVIFGDIKIN